MDVHHLRSPDAFDLAHIACAREFQLETADCVLRCGEPVARRPPAKRWAGRVGLHCRQHRYWRRMRGGESLQRRRLTSTGGIRSIIIVHTAGLAQAGRERVLAKMHAACAGEKTQNAVRRYRLASRRRTPSALLPALAGPRCEPLPKLPPMNVRGSAAAIGPKPPDTLFPS